MNNTTTPKKILRVERVYDVPDTVAERCYARLREQFPQLTISIVSTWPPRDLGDDDVDADTLAVEFALGEIYDDECARMGAEAVAAVAARPAGLRGDCLIVDDLLNAKEPEKITREAIEKARAWWNVTMSSRLNDQHAERVQRVLGAIESIGIEHGIDLAGARGCADVLALFEALAPDALTRKIDHRTVLDWLGSPEINRALAGSFT